MVTVMLELDGYWWILMDGYEWILMDGWIGSKEIDEYYCLIRLTKHLFSRCHKLVIL